MRKKKTLGEFINEASSIHKNKYNYKLVNYIDNNTKVIITCPIHGNFEQRPNNHLNKNGCPQCSNTKNKTTNEFIINAKKIHYNKYDYTKVKYINNNTKVILNCVIHGEFLQSPAKHLSGQGCPVCGNRIKKTTEKFIKQAIIVHGDEFDYNSVDYVNSRNKVNIICKVHGTFQQIPTDHLMGHGCHECAGTKNKTTEQFIVDAKRIHFDKYDYSKVEYKNAKCKIELICRKHGNFTIIPNDHLNGKGCSICNESKGEKLINNFLIERGIQFIKQKRFGDCKNIQTLPFDFYLPEYNVCIEYHGVQHYNSVTRFGGIESFNQQQKRDKIKCDYCSQNGINLIIVNKNNEKKINELLNAYKI